MEVILSTHLSSSAFIHVDGDQTKFKLCNSCGTEWEHFPSFSADTQIRFFAYQAHSDSPDQGLLLFNHVTDNCGSTLTIPLRVAHKAMQLETPFISFCAQETLPIDKCKKKLGLNCCENFDCDENIVRRIVKTLPSPRGSILYNLDWQLQFSLGIPSIDEQHRQWVKLMAQLFDTLIMPDPETRDSSSSQILSELFAYTIYHLEYEEQLFSDFDYPEKLEHTLEHDRLRATIENYRSRLKSREVISVENILGDMQQWLVNHICNSDRAYVGFLKVRMSVLRKRLESLS